MVRLASWVDILLFPNHDINEYKCFIFRYSDISLEEIEKVCPACRGICNCKVWLRGDNMVKVHLSQIQRDHSLYYSINMHTDSKKFSCRSLGVEE